MKAVCLIGMTNGVYARTGGLINAVTGTLTELGLLSTQIKLPDFYLPYYEEGSSPEGFIKLASVIRDVKNIVVAYNVTQNQPSAAMKVFLEYLEGTENKRLFEDKNILNMAISFTDGEREAASFVSGLLEKYGAFELTRICVSGASLNGLLNGSLPMDAIEKYAEDYYRLVRQNRIFLRSSAYRDENVQQDRYSNLMNKVETSVRNTRQSSLRDLHDLEDISAAQNQIMEELPGSAQGGPNYPGYAPESKKSGIDFDAFNSRQQEDIEELTKLFATKLKNDDSAQADIETFGYNYEASQAPERKRNSRKPAEQRQKHQQTHQPSGGVNPPYQSSAGVNPPSGPYAAPGGVPADGFSGMAKKTRADTGVTPRNKTCKQMTQSLPHYFQPQLAQDTDAIFQLFISGEEDFSGYLIIKNRENEYYDGQHNSPDITIISGANVWLDVLKGKFTAQKAFMTGQLKVRGNFMLLNRFDQLYKVM